MPNDARLSLAGTIARRGLRRAVAWIAGIVVAFGAIGFLALPPLVRPALERTLSTALDRKVTIERLRINPFALSVTLGEVAIADRGEGPPALTLAELYANGEALSLFRWAPVISELKLTRPTLRVVRNSDKTYNFSDLVEHALAGPSGPPPRFSISNIEVVDGRIDFDDRPEHRQHQITELAIGIPFVSSLPTQVEIKVQPTFSALVNGRPIGVTGETRPFKDTHETVLHWALNSVPLQPYLDYVPTTLPVKVESGRVDARIDLSFIGRGAGPPQLTLSGSVGVADLVLNERAGTPLLRVQSLAVTLERLDPIGGSAELRSIAGEGVEMEVRRGRDGALNLVTLAPPEAPKTSTAPPFRFRVGKISLIRSKVHLVDDAVTPAYAATLSDVAAEVTNLASAGGEKASVSLSFVTDAGERLTHRGTLGLAPISADGRLQVVGLKLGRLFPYYASALNLAVDDGALDLSTDVRFDGAGQAMKLALANLDATVNNLKMRLPDEKELLWRVPVLAVHGGAVDVFGRTISFDTVEGQGAVASIHRTADGRFNFDRLIRTSEGGVGSTSSTRSGETWQVGAGKVALEDFSGSLTDETTSPAAHISVSRVSVRGENLSNAAKAKGRATLQATVNKRGTLSLAGPIATAPFAGTLSVVAKNIDLVPFQPYITQAARLQVTGGAASGRGALDFATGAAQHAGFKGELTLSEVIALDEANATELLKWKALSLTGVEAQSDPLAVTVGEIALDGLFARLILNENGEFNLQQLARSRTPAPAPSAPTDGSKTVELATPPSSATTWLKLGKATLADGTLDFTDHFVRPNYSAHLTGLAGNLSSLAFDQPADLELHGNVQESAPVEIVGRINPLAKSLFLDVKASASDIELSPLSPYSGKYVGYGIEKGKLSMKVRYLIEERKLTAENSIILDQLTFGGKVESPDAIKIPVLLAVALLKDRNGVIKFDLPVGGSLDDPQFSVGGLVFRALVNLLVKIVTAPFAILGSLAGHGEELAYVEFVPGSAALDAAGDGKVKSVAKVLADRPALKLDVAGRVDPATDREGLKRAALDQRIRVEKFNELARRGEPPSSPDAVEVPAAEYEALLTRVYKAAEFTKPRNAIGLPKDLPRDEMEGLLLANTIVADEDLRSLADRRAQTVRASLLDAEHVPRERVFLVAPRLDAEGVKDKGKPTRVDFALH
jgi:uncharacterized protein involved in outer membrane biogenesis